MSKYNFVFSTTELHSYTLNNSHLRVINSSEVKQEIFKRQKQ